MKKSNDDIEVLKETIAKLREKTDKQAADIKILEKVIEKRDTAISRIEREKIEWFSIEKNASAYADVKQFEILSKRIENLEESLKKKTAEIEELKVRKDKLIEYANTNKINVDKATEVRKQKKTERKDKYMESIKKLLEEEPELKVKEIIERLGISKMTYYNLGLNKV